MKTKAIKKAAERYKANRDNQQTIKWDKKADQDNLFDAMYKAGLTKCWASAGSHFGTKTNKHNTRLFVIDIGEEIHINLFQDFETYWKSLMQ